MAGTTENSPQEGRPFKNLFYGCDRSRLDIGGIKTVLQLPCYKDLGWTLEQVLEAGEEDRPPLAAYTAVSLASIIRN